MAATTAADDNNICLFHFAFRCESREASVAQQTTKSLSDLVVFVAVYPRDERMYILWPFRKWFRCDRGSVVNPSKEKKSFICLCYAFWAADDRTREKNGDGYLSVVIKCNRYSLLIFFPLSVCSSQTKNMLPRLDQANERVHSLRRCFVDALQTHIEMYSFATQTLYRPSTWSITTSQRCRVIIFWELRRRQRKREREWERFSLSTGIVVGAKSTFGDGRAERKRRKKERVARTNNKTSHFLDCFSFRFSASRCLCKKETFSVSVHCSRCICSVQLCK